MCDEDLVRLQNILLSVPRREPKILLQRAEYIFPALENGLVSVFVFVHTDKKAVNVYFQKIIFGIILPLNYYFSTFVQFNCLRFLLCCHTVFGKYSHIRDLMHYILLLNCFIDELIYNF
jgi:hypothetical protein